MVADPGNQIKTTPAPESDSTWRARRSSEIDRGEYRRGISVSESGGARIGITEGGGQSGNTIRTTARWDRRLQWRHGDAGGEYGLIEHGKWTEHRRAMARLLGGNTFGSNTSDASPWTRADSFRGKETSAEFRRPDISQNNTFQRSDLFNALPRTSRG
jgi:hypothetical protein